MPIAIYSSGATTLPVCPTCQSFGAYPASTAARDAPTPAPNLSASGSIYLAKFSRLCMARPPETMILAEEAGQAGIGGGSGSLDRGVAADAGCLEGRGPDRDHLLGILGLHGLDRVAGIDRPLEGVGRNHLDDFRYLHDVK